MKLDAQLTKEIQNWLASEPHDVIAGANLLFKLNRNKALYNSALRRPDKFDEKISYELKKILRIRLDNMTMSEVADLEAKVLPLAQETLESLAQLPDGEAESGTPIITPEGELPPQKYKGKRPDHAQLPPEIQALWDNNFDVYKTINLLFEECKALNDARPCDRYDKVQLLAAADTKYRRNLQKYDEYVIVEGTPESDAPQLSEVDAKKVNAARKSLSKWRTKFGEADTPEAEDKARAKMQASVDLILSLGQGIAPDTRSFLVSIGVTVNDNEA